MQKIRNSYNTGLWHENLAKDLLENKGYKLIKHNYRGRFAQVDLIMMSPKYLVFVEVKKTKPGFESQTLKKFLFKQKKRILSELFVFYKTKAEYKHLKPVLMLIIFAKSKQPDLYLYYLTP